MPKPPGRSHQIAAAEELTGIHLLHSPVNIMKENICGSFLLPVPGHHGCSENGGHSARCGAEETTGGVNHDDIPLRLVDERRQVCEMFTRRCAQWSYEGWQPLYCARNGPVIAERAFASWGVLVTECLVPFANKRDEEGPSRRVWRAGICHGCPPRFPHAWNVRSIRHA